MSVIEKPLSDTENGKASRDMASELDDLRSCFAQMRSDLSSLIEKFVGAGKSSVMDCVGDLKEKGVASAQAAKQKIADHPVAGAMAGLAVGFLLAQFMKSHNKQSD